MDFDWQSETGKGLTMEVATHFITEKITKAFTLLLKIYFMSVHSFTHSSQIYSFNKLNVYNIPGTVVPTEGLQILT